MDYKDKYNKYKTKYLELKNKMIGGEPKLIIHISGPSGSGKTTLGVKLKDEFGSKIVVKDIDDLRYDFIKEFYGMFKKWNKIDSIAYQKFIDDYIYKINKPLIFVGLNHMPWWHPNLYYDMHSKYNFYINIPDNTVIRQKCIRFLQDLQNIKNDKIAMDDLINDNKKFIKITTNNIKEECGDKKIIKYNKKWNIDYKKQGYKIMSRDNIYKNVVKILKNQLEK